MTTFDEPAGAHAPTADDLARDLVADLALCDAATRGPWRVGAAVRELHRWPCRGHCHNVWAEDPEGGGSDVTAPCAGLSSDDALMMAAARAGWPAAIRRAISAEAILSAPVVALFADGREPTTNERHLLNLLSWREREIEQAKAEIARLQALVTGPADRVAAQAEVIQRRAEGSPLRDLVTEIRRYVLAHGVLLGECVAWDQLKRLTGVGQGRDCPSEAPGDHEGGR